MQEQLKDALVQHATAVASVRLQNALAAENALGVGETPPAQPTTPWMTQDRLQTVGVFVSLASLAECTLADRVAAYAWADAVDRSSTAPDTEIPERPEWLPSRNKVWCDEQMRRESADDQTTRALFWQYHVDWTEPDQRDDGEEQPYVPSFAEQLEEIDEQMAAELAAVGVNLASPEENDAARWMLLVDHLLESAHEDQQMIEESQDAENLHYELLGARYESGRATTRRRLERTLALIRQTAERLHFGKKKSMDLPHGTIGYRDFAEKHRVNDVDAAIAWAREHLPDAVEDREATTITTVLHKATLITHHLNSGEDVPGVERIDAKREWYAKPEAHADEMGRTPSRTHEPAVEKWSEPAPQ